MVGSIANAYGVQDFIDLGLTNAYAFSSDDLQSTLNALLQFSGEEFSTTGRYSTETTERNFNNIGSRLSAIRQGMRSASGLAFNLNGTDLIAQTQKGAPDGSLPMPLIGGSAGDSGGDLGWGWFGSADYGFGDRDATVNEDEFEYDSFGFTIGLDYVFDNDWVVGGTVSWEDVEIDFDDGSQGANSQSSGGGIDTDGYTISGFTMYNGPVYFTGILSVSDWNYDMDREARVPSAVGGTVSTSLTGSTEGKQISGEFTVGKVFGSGATTYDVYLAGDFQFLEIDGYTETDLTPGSGLALEYGDQDIDSRQAVLGGVLRHNINTDSFGVLTPYLGLEWHHEFDNEATVIDSRYVFGLPGSNPRGFLTPTDDPDDDYGEVTLGISTQMQNSLFLFLQWNTVVALEDTSANVITFGVRGVF